MVHWIAEAYRSYLKLAARQPWAVLGGWVAVSVLMAWIGSDLKVRGDLDDLFPDDTPAVVRGRETRRILGNTQEIRILIGGQSRDVNRAVAGEIAQYLEGRPEEITRVEWRRDVSFFEKNGLLFASFPDLEELDHKVTSAIQAGVKKDLGLDDFELEDEEPKEADKAAEEPLPTVEELKRKYHVEELQEYFESSDGTVIAVKAVPTFKPGDATRTQALNDVIDAKMKALIAAHPGSGLEYTMDGDFSQVTKAAKQILDDSAASGMWSMLGIVVVILAFFRRFRALIAVVVVLVAATTWVLGFAVLTIGYLNLVTSIIFAILFGLGVDYLVHGMGRVEEEFHDGVPFAVAVERGLFGLGRPAFNAMATTAVTFFALTVFDFRGFSQLGLVAGVGIALALLAFFVVYPPLAFGMHRVWAQRPRKAAPPEHELGENLSLPPVSRRKKRLAWGIVSAFGVLVAAMVGVAVSGLHFDSDMGRFRMKDNQAESSLKQKYKQVESKNASPALVVTQDLAETKRVQRFFDAAIAAGKEHPEQARFPHLTEVSSVWSFVPAKQADKLALIHEVKRKIDNKYNALDESARKKADELLPYLSPKVFGPEELPAWVKAKFTDTEGRFGRYVLLYASGRKSDALTALAIEGELGTINLPATPEAPALTLTSAATYYISGEAYAVVKREGPLAALLGFLVVFAVVIVDTRNVGKLMRILGPVTGSFAVTLGLLTLFDVPLDLFNVVVLPQIFGIGIDNGIHLNHRLMEGGPRVTQAMIASGWSAGISVLLTVVGFAALLPVQNEGLRSIGVVACIGVSVAFLLNAGLYVAFNWIARPLDKSES